jgi:hypothetical protein
MGRTLAPVLMAALAFMLPASDAQAEDTTATLVAVGDTADMVHERLGEARGFIRSGDYEVLLYPLGKVELRGGVVTAVNLVSQAEADERQRQREADAQARREQQDARRQARYEEGITARERTLGSTEFAAASGARQVAYWEQFRQRYPEVPVAAELAAAHSRRDSELQNEQMQQRLADMERRVADAEAAAREAEREAEAARRARSRVIYTSPYGYDYGPVMVGPYRTTTDRRGYTSSSGPSLSGSWTIGSGAYPYTHGYTVETDNRSELTDDERERIARNPLWRVTLRD